MIKTTTLGLFAGVLLLLLSQVYAQYPVTCPTPEPGAPPVLLPNPVDCTKYYVCDGRNPIAMDCPFPLVFDPTINACQSPGLYQCIPTTELTTSTTTTPAPTTEDPAPPSTTPDEPATEYTSVMPEIKLHAVV